MTIKTRNVPAARKPLRDLLTGSVCSIGVIAGGLLISDTAFAQAKIEQMIVTAQKRSQDIQAVPASISAFSGEGLENRQIKTVADLATATPNVNWNLVNGVVQLSIRGVSPDGFSTAVDPAVALHIDGVYQARSGALLGLVMTDLDNVEVLRGPQGTLYGRNANAGVINLNTKKPTDTFEGSGTIFGGSFERYGAKGYVSGPITDNISARLTAYVDRSSGYGTNLKNGHDIEGSNAYGGRIAVRLKPTEDVTVDLSLAHSYDHSSNAYYAFSELRGPNYAALLAGGFDGRYSLAPYEVYNGYDPETKTVSNLAIGTIAWEITPDVTLKSITGWSSYEYRSNLDLDQTLTDYLRTQGPGVSRTTSQEFNLSAKLFDRLDTVVGLYYLRDVAFAGADVPLPGGNPFGSNLGLRLYNMIGQQTSTSKAAFFDATLSITDQLRLVGGVRRTLDHRKTVMDSYALFANGTKAGCPNSPYPDLDYHSTTGKIGAQYDITPNIMAYISWQNGFKTGGYNPSQCGNSYKPERIYSWEGGVKSTLFNDSVQFNISVFDYRYSNMQLNRTTFATSVIDNAASSKLRGAEIELNAYLTDDLKAELGLGFLDSKYGPLKSNNAAAIGNPLVDQTGFQLPRAPKSTVNAALEYTMRIGDFGELTSRAEYSYTSRVYFTSFDEAIAQQAGFSLFNAIFTYQPDNCPLTIRAFARNILDKAHRSGGVTSGIMIYARGTWAPPRTLGAEITAKF